MSPRRHILSGSSWEYEFGYSRAVVDGEWIHVAGTTGYDYESGEISDDIVDQARQTLANIEKALGEAGATLDDVVRVRYYVTDIDEFYKLGPVLLEAFSVARPAATMIACGLIDSRMKIEIEVTARCRSVI